MSKGKLANLLLVVFSTGIVLFLAEVVFQHLIFSDNEQFDFLENPAAYAIYVRDENENLYKEDYWKLIYTFKSPPNIEDPHPLLGWTSGFNPITLEHWAVNKREGRIPVLLFGDSFASCVDSVDCFEHIMNRDTSFAKNHFLFNYGVGGYGVDQTYLLLKECLPKYENPVVIFSVLTTDLDRSMLNFRDAQKPYFNLVNDKLELQGFPITMSSDQFIENNPPEIDSYLWNKATNVIVNRVGQSEKKHQASISKVEELNAAILEKAFDEIKSTGAKGIVLIFKPTWQKDDWRLDFLKKTCELNGMPYIVNDDLLKADMKKTGRNARRYLISNDGHPTSISNHVVSNKLIEWVISPNFINNPPSANNYGKEKR